MPQSPSTRVELVLRTYFHSKDENRPHLLDEVFSEHALLHVHNASENITFPSVTQGRTAIAAVLVGDFNRQYENIYSFYLARPPQDALSFSCQWFVVMTEKESKAVRVGCGLYEWGFGETPLRLADTLVIRISAMQVLPPDSWPVILSWLRSLSHPWSSASQILAHAPSLLELAPVLEYLRRFEPPPNSSLDSRRSTSGA